MTTDITELAQMKGQKVEGSYYLAECTDCGKMYPSNKLNGGEPLFSGDYGECYCPHCNADDAAIGDCGDTAAIAWNYQQGRIDALVEALEKAQQYAKERDAENQDLMLTVGRLRVEREGQESRTVTVKLPDYRNTYKGPFADEVEHQVRLALELFSSAAGIKVEAE
ncbi:TPA: ead/Ea22-like family protein [Escherichia coli]|nr:ead/Ea22-like family protein [Escherichia coli]